MGGSALDLGYLRGRRGVYVTPVGDSFFSPHQHSTLFCRTPRFAFLFQRKRMETENADRYGDAGKREESESHSFISPTSATVAALYLHLLEHRSSNSGTKNFIGAPHHRSLLPQKKHSPRFFCLLGIRHESCVAERTDVFCINSCRKFGRWLFSGCSSTSPLPSGVSSEREKVTQKEDICLPTKRAREIRGKRRTKMQFICKKNKESKSDEPRPGFASLASSSSQTSNHRTIGSDHPGTETRNNAGTHLARVPLLPDASFAPPCCEQTYVTCKVCVVWV